MTDSKPTSVSKKRRVLSVKPGDAQDACPLCRIHRMNAGFLKVTCGKHYLKPECFVQDREEAA
jgi:hypothetical protein